MRTFHITSTAFKGYVEVAFSDNDLLVNIDVRNAEISELQHKWFLDHIPGNVSGLQKMVSTVESLRQNEVVVEINFKNLVKRYNGPANQKLAMAERMWNRRNKAEQKMIWDYIPKYDRSREPWQSKMHLSTYINSEIWNG